MTREEAIKFLKSGCLTLACEYHVKNRCNADYREKEAKKDEALKMAIADMEKQIPKKPINALDVDVKVRWYSCPICKQGIGWGRKRDVKYCWKCGQALDWSEERG